MVAFAFVWMGQLPFGLAGAWWEHRHGASKVGVLEYAIDSWFALGGQVLFVCAGIEIVMAFARPFRRVWCFPGGPVSTGLAVRSAFLPPYRTPHLKKLHRHDLRVSAAHLAKV